MRIVLGTVAAAMVLATPVLARGHEKPPTPIGSVADWIPPFSYPPASMRAGEEGRVYVRLAVSAEGRVTGCDIARSSGYPRLDEATCRLIQRHATFAPATDRHGKPVAGTYESHGIVWKLDSAPTPPAPAGTGE